MKQWWHTEDNCSPNLSKSSLGSYFYHVLKSGAEVGQVWAFNPSYERCSVFMSIQATEEQKNKIEENTKFKFKHPPKLHIN